MQHSRDTDNHPRRILLLNPLHTAIGSRIPQEHLPPLGLLSIGGRLIDAGHEVELLDADRVDMASEEIVRRVLEIRPHMVMFGHSGSSTAHVTIASLAARPKVFAPEIEERADPARVHGRVVAYRRKRAFKKAPVLSGLARICT